MEDIITSNIYLLILITPLAIVAYLLIPMIWGAGYAPSPKRDVAEILRYSVDKYLAGKEDLEIIDLGSGFGGVCFKALEVFPRARCTGVEIDPLKVMWSRIASRFKKCRERARFIWGNIFDIDLRGYDLIYMFLWPPTVEKIEDKILREANRLVVVISLEHPLKKIYRERYRDFYIGFYRINTTLA